MTAWVQYLLAPVENPGDDPLARLRLRFLQLMAAATVLIGVIGTVAQIAIGPTPAGLIATGIVFALGVGLTLLTRSQRLRFATLLLVGVLGLLLFAPVEDHFLYLFLPLGTLTLFAAAALTSRAIYIAVNVVVFGRGIIELAVLSVRAETAGAQPGAMVVTLIVMMVALLIVSFAARYIVEQMRNAVRETRRGADLLAATAQIAQITAGTLDLNELFSRSVELIRDYFGFYHVQVFMLDDRGEFAALVSSTGEAGQQLLARKHRLPVGSASVIGRVTYFGEPVIAADTDLDPLHRPNDLLPNTRSEMAVPVFDGERIIGALDVQSTAPRAFAPLDVQVLETLADLLAVAIRNARLFEEKTRANAEQERLIQMADANMREIQRLNQQLTRIGWSQFLEQQPEIAGVTLRDGTLGADADWSQPLIEAARAARPVVMPSSGDSSPVAVPVLLRGEVIGAIEVEPDGSLLPADVVDVVEAVAQRLAISLENARLFEEANLATAQEQRINTITTQYQSVSSVDDLLRITLTELSETLGARRGAIRLGSAGPANGDSVS